MYQNVAAPVQTPAGFDKQAAEEMLRSYEGGMDVFGSPPRVRGGRWWHM